MSYFIKTLSVTMLFCASLIVISGSTVGQKSSTGIVTLAEDASSYTLANGIVTAVVSKRSGDLVSLKYKDLEMVGGVSGHPHGYWSHTPGKDSQVKDAVTINPTNNAGERGEVSVKAISGGVPVGNGPGGSVIADIEIRYALGRGDSGIYTYSIFDHKPEYPYTSLGEARFAAKLTPSIFDFMTVDANRRKVMPKPEDWAKGTQLNMKEVRRLNTGIYKGEVEHKYDYSAVQFDIPAFGWSSTEHHVGLWFVNPSIEYLSGGATKVELTAHLDGSDATTGEDGGGAPTVLNYWRGSHYGGSSCVVTQGESWTKVVGPFLIYCNSAPNHEEMWKDALSKAAKETSAWPYDWVNGVSYPHKNERGAVSGKLVLNDPQASSLKITNLLVGLSAPDYTFRDQKGNQQIVDWQLDAKNYEFWARGDQNGNFAIPAVRPGKYTLHAIANGVLGEFAKTDITVEPGKPLNLGSLKWQPVRYGRQVWEIGIPNRTAEEFRHGDHYWQWGLYNEYPKEFPNDVNFVIGKSDWRKDWNYVQPPRIDGVKVTPTTWSITFDLPQGSHGKATLRLAIAGSRVSHGIEVSVNDKSVGGTGPLPDTGVMHRDGIRGYWVERDVTFDAAVLKPGTNIIKLHVPANNWVSGVLYDYLRLEVDESAKSSAQ